MKQVRLVWLAAGMFVLTIIGANAHLAYVAFASAPPCLDHARLGESATVYPAARSSC